MFVLKLLFFVSPDIPLVAAGDVTLMRPLMDEMLVPTSVYLSLGCMTIVWQNVSSHTELPGGREDTIRHRFHSANIPFSLSRLFINLHCTKMNHHYGPSKTFLTFVKC